MPNYWYKLVAGPAPWSDQTSYAYNTIYTDNYGGATTFGTTSYGKDYDSSISMSTSAYLSTTGGAASNTNNFTDENNGGNESGETSSGGEKSNSYSGSNSYSHVQAYISETTVQGTDTNGNTYAYRVTGVDTSTYTASDSHSFSRRDYIVGTIMNWSESSTYSHQEQQFTTATYSYSSSGTNTLRILTANTTTFVDYVLSGGVGTTDTYDATTQVSTSQFTSTGTTDSDHPMGVTNTYASTCLTDTSTSYTTTLYITYLGSAVGYRGKTYAAGAFHAQLVIQALPNEVLYLKTTTGSNYAHGNIGLGPSFTQTTLSAALTQTTHEYNAQPSYSYTNTAWGISYQYITENHPAKDYLMYSATLDQPGAIGGAESTHEYPNVLITIGTADFVTVRTNVTSTSASNSGFGYAKTATFSSWIQINGISLTQENITYNTPNGGTAIGQVYTSFAYASWVSVIGYYGLNSLAGPPGSITNYISPANVVAGGAYPQLTRMNRKLGFQAPNGMGSLGKQGRSISANKYLPIGGGNFSYGSPNIQSPLLWASTAQDGASYYSFSISSDGKWLVSISISEGAISTYTASVDVRGEELYAFGYADGGGYVNSPVTAFAADGLPVFGGPNAYLNAGQNLTINGGGAAYTIGDGGLTRSSAEIFLQPYKTISLGPSIIAVDTFRTCIDSPQYIGGLPQVVIHAYSAP